MLKRKKKKQQDATELENMINEEKNLPLFDITVQLTEPFPTLLVTNKRNTSIAVFKFLIRDEQSIPYQVAWLSHLIPYKQKRFLLTQPIEEKEKAEVLITWSVNNEEKSLSFPLKDVLVFPQEPQTVEPLTVEPLTVEPQTVEPLKNDRSSSEQAYVPSWYKNHNEREESDENQGQQSSGPFIPHWYKNKSNNSLFEKNEQNHMVKKKDDEVRKNSEKEEQKTAFDIFDEVIKSSYEHPLADEQKSCNASQDFEVEESLEKNEDAVESKEVVLDEGRKQENEIHVNTLQPLATVSHSSPTEDEEIQTNISKRTGDFEIQSQDLLSVEKTKRKAKSEMSNKSVQASEEALSHQNEEKISIDAWMSNPNIEEIEDEIESEFKNIKI